MERLVIEEVERVLRHQCAALDPDSVPLPEAPSLYLTLDRIAKLVDGAKTRLLARVDAARPGGPAGERSTADWDAARTGTTPSAAREKLDTSKRLHRQPGVDEALAKGELSGEQANAVSGAAGADPSAERRLLDAAKATSVRDLKKECDRVKANAHPDPEARRKAILAGRHVRTWTDAEGGWNLKMRHVAEVGAEIEAILARYTQRAFEEARAEGRREPHDAYRADGLHAMAEAAAGGGVVEAPKGASATQTKTFVHIDFESLRRGRTEPGSICHIDRIGPVDLQWVRENIGESFVVALLKEGDTIHDLVHLGRHATALQRSYKEAEGIRCERPGCDRTEGLELDHVVDWAGSHVTRVDDLAWLCRHDHDLKTHHGYRLAGPPGGRTWWGPDGTAIAEDRPPPQRALFADPDAA